MPKCLDCNIKARLIGSDENYRYYACPKCGHRFRMRKPFRLTRREWSEMVTMELSRQGIFPRKRVVIANIENLATIWDLKTFPQTTLTNFTPRKKGA